MNCALNNTFRLLKLILVKPLFRTVIPTVPHQISECEPINCVSSLFYVVLVNFFLFSVLLWWRQHMMRQRAPTKFNFVAYFE